MKRDMDLIRALMLSFEGETEIDLSDYSEDQQVYHSALLLDAGFIDGRPRTDGKGEISSVHVFRLTWEGHEFIDSARNDTVWNKAKDKFTKAGVDVGIDILKAILKSLMMDKLGMG